MSLKDLKGKLSKAEMSKIIGGTETDPVGDCQSHGKPAQQASNLIAVMDWFMQITNAHTGLFKLRVTVKDGRLGNRRPSLFFFNLDYLILYLLLTRLLFQYFQRTYNLRLTDTSIIGY